MTFTAVSQTSFYITGGTLPVSASSYIERQADKDLTRALLAGEFCYVLNSRQMGKSSLMLRTAERLKAEGVKVAVLDLTAIGQNLSPEQWYGGLLSRLGIQLGLEDELEDFFLDQPHLGPQQRWLQALTGIVLKPIQGALVLFVDEIDVTRSLPFSADEFFAGIRQCYIGRANDPALNRLTFCLLGTATPADLIQQAWDAHNLLRVQELLMETKPFKGRGFEWSYWNRLCHLDRLTLQAHNEAVTSVSFSPDGRHLLTACHGLTAKVWDAFTGRPLLTLRGHGDAVLCADISPDGTRIVTGSRDGTARLWDAQTGRELLTFKGGASLIQAVAFFPDGKRIVTGSFDGVAVVWLAE